MRDLRKTKSCINGVLAFFLFPCGLRTGGFKTSRWTGIHLFEKRDESYFSFLFPRDS
jgi:hypothetical protein